MRGKRFGDGGKGVDAGEYGSSFSPSYCGSGPGDVVVSSVVVAEGAVESAGGEGDNGWSDTGVVEREGFVDGFGELAADASPIVNLAFNLSSNVTLRPPLTELALAGLPGRCETNVFLILFNAGSAGWPRPSNDERDSRVESWDCFGECCERLSTACRHPENMTLLMSTKVEYVKSRKGNTPGVVTRDGGELKRCS